MVNIKLNIRKINDMKQKDTISKRELIDWIMDEGMKIFAELGYNRIDSYREGIIDGYRNVIKKLKGEL